MPVMCWQLSNDFYKIKYLLLSESKRISVKMSNGTKLKGYVNQIGEDSFNLKNSNTGQIKTVAYRDVGR